MTIRFPTDPQTLAGMYATLEATQLLCECCGEFPAVFLTNVDLYAWPPNEEEILTVCHECVRWYPGPTPPALRGSDLPASQGGRGSQVQCDPARPSDPLPVATGSGYLRRGLAPKSSVHWGSTVRRG